MAASIFNGSAVKILKDILRFKTGAQIITGDSDDPTSVAKAGSISDLYLRDGTAEVYIKNDSGTTTNWTMVSTFAGPGSSTDNAIAVWDGTSGSLLKNSVAILSAIGALSGLTQVDVDDIRLDANTISTTVTDQDLNLSPDGTGQINATKDLLLSGDATQNLQAVTKQQLDAVQALIEGSSWQDAVKDKDLTAPPGSPATGDRYLIGLDTAASTATGAWATHDGEIAEYNGATWDFTLPVTGYHITADDESDGIYLFGGTTWTKKLFEATTASGFLSKSGVDIQLTNVNSQNIVVGNVSNVAASVNTSSVGDILANSTTGLTIKAGVIVDADINATAGITLSKLAALTANRAVSSDASGFLVSSAVTDTELGYVSGVTSAIQTQLNGKEPTLAKGNLTEATSSIITITGGTGAVIGAGTTLEVQQATTLNSGYLTSTDWNTFNSKEPAVTKGNLTEATSAILTILGGTGAVIGTGASIEVQQATTLASGYLSSTDWNTFNNKEPAVTKGDLTEATSAILTILGGTGSVIGTGASIQVQQSTTSTDGYLSSTDWNTFNNKEPAVTKGNLTEIASTILNISGGTGAVIGAGTTIQVQQSSTVTDGFLAAADFLTFDAKEPAVAKGDLTEATSAVLTILGGTGSVIGAGTSIQVTQSTAVADGYLSSADWSTFNNKEPAVTKGDLTEATSSVLTILGGTGAVIGSGASIQVSQATTSTAGYLSSTDWNTFNNKEGGFSTASSSGIFTAVNKTIHLVNTSGGAATVTLPASANNLLIHLKDATGNARANNITISPASGTIDGAASLVIDSDRGSVLLACDGTNWHLI